MNSDDSDFDWWAVEQAVTRRNRGQAGAQSIKGMAEASKEDCRQTKRFVKTLEYTFGAPGTRYGQDLWINRTEGLRRDFLNHQNLRLPSSVENVLELFTYLAPRLRCINYAPNKCIFTTGYRVLAGFRAHEYKDAPVSTYNKIAVAPKDYKRGTIRFLEEPKVPSTGISARQDPPSQRMPSLSEFVARPVTDEEISAYLEEEARAAAENSTRRICGIRHSNKPTARDSRFDPWRVHFAADIQLLYRLLARDGRYFTRIAF